MYKLPVQVFYMTLSKCSIKVNAIISKKIISRTRKNVACIRNFILSASKGFQITKSIASDKKCKTLEI